MTVELADYLIGLDKYILSEGELTKSFLVNIGFPMSFRLMLSSPDDLDQNLMVDIKESEKKTLKISLHHQDNSTQNGLLRIDFNSRHFNPVEITPSVPEAFIPFKGLWLDEYAGHIHYVVDGYKPLAWAIPLEFDDFPVKNLNGSEDYSKILNAFFEKINVRTKFSYYNQTTIL